MSDKRKAPQAGGAIAMQRGALNSSALAIISNAANFGNIPPELREMSIWFPWRATPRPGGGIGKPPVTQAGRFAGRSDPPMPFDEALGVMERLKLDGLGMVIPPGYVALDLDDALNERGELSPFLAREALPLFSGVGYAEWSPSGRGLHVITRGRWTGAKSKYHVKGQKVEIFQGSEAKRYYLTMTGRVWGRTYAAIGEGQQALDALRRVLEPDGESVATAQASQRPSGGNGRGPARPASLSDEKLIEVAGRAANGARFRALWAGDCAGYPSCSEAHLALANIIAFYASGPDQVARVLGLAPIEHPKWARRDYLERLAAKAWRRGGGGYGSRVGTGGGAHRGESTPEPPPWLGADAPPPPEVAPQEPQGKKTPLHLRWYRSRRTSERRQASLTPPDWVVEGLFEMEELVIFYGPPGSGKSILLGDQAACIASGRAWLEGLRDVPGAQTQAIAGYVTTKRRVLWLDMDSGRKTTDRRFDALARVYGFDDDDLHIVVANGEDAFRLDTLDGADELRAYVGEFGIEVIFVDTLRDALGAVDENDSKVAVLMEKLRWVANTTGAAIVVLHHATKGGDGGLASLRGSSAIAGKVDAAFYVAELDAPYTVIRIENTKMRNNPHIAPITALVDSVYADGMMTELRLFQTPAPEQERPLSKSQRYVLRFLEEHGPSDMASIKENADICSPNAARQAVYSLVEAGLVARVNKGGKGHPARYDLVKNQVV